MGNGLPRLTEQEILPARYLRDVDDLSAVLAVGDYLATQSRVFVVTKVSFREVRVRETVRGVRTYVDDRPGVEDGVTCWNCVAASHGAVRRFRLAESGRMFDGVSDEVFVPLRVNGEAVEFGRPVC